MATKSYPQTEETSGVASEPVVAYHIESSVMDVYQVTDIERKSIMHAKEQFARGEFCSENEMDKMVAEWLN